MRATVLSLAVIVVLGLAQLTAVQSADPAVSPSISIGDDVDLQLTGDLAKQYWMLINEEAEVPDGLRVNTLARLTQKTETGEYRLEHFVATSSFTPKRSKSDTPRMLTLTVNVKADAIKYRDTPAGTEVYGSPGDKPVKTVATLIVTTSAVSATAFPYVELDSLKGVRLRSWKLDREVRE
jgi:hypothetical protein